MTLIIGLVAFAAVLFIIGGVLIGTKDKSIAPFAPFTVAIFLLIGANFLADKYYSQLKGDFAGNYIVKDKLVAPVTGRKIYILYSADEERERFADLSEYPPKGYKETVIDGVTMLIPEVKQ